MKVRRAQVECAFREVAVGNNALAGCLNHTLNAELLSVDIDRKRHLGGIGVAQFGDIPEEERSKQYGQKGRCYISLAEVFQI